MDFELTEEEDLIRRAAADLAQRRLLPSADERDLSERFPAPELGELARAGLLGVNVPETLDGAEAGAVAYALAVMEVAKADASVAVAMAVTNMTAELICAWGTEEQKRSHVPKLVGGPYVCGSFALSEPQAGSDAASVATTAVRTSGGFRLRGTKQWITSGTHAGLFVVWAKTDPSTGSRGLSAFLVEKGTPGLEVARVEDKLGLRGSTTVQLVLDDVELAEGALLGREGDGLRIALMALDGGRIGIGAQAVGIATAALEAAIRYARERVQFGVPIAQHQAIAMMLGDMTTWRDASRLLVLRAAYLKQQRLPFSLEASMAKLFASEKANRICDMAVQIHGGYGYTRDFPVERHLRDVRVTRIYEGTSEIQRLLMAREIFKKGMA